MAEKKYVPKVRFFQFDSDWKEHLVGDLLIERVDLTPKSNEYPLMAFVANQGIVPKGERYDRSALVTDAENKLYKKTEYGDFIYSSNNLESGSIGLNKYGKATISPVYSIFSPTEFGVSSFLGRRLVRSDFIKEMIKWRQGVVYGQWRIHESDFEKIIVKVPNVDEQAKIGIFLQQIDSLIIDSQKKLEKLQVLKSGMLKKMFPKVGADVPEIRFKGYTEAWNCHRLKDIVQPYSDPVHTPDDGYFRLGIRSHGKGTFHSFVAPGMGLETAQMHRVKENNLILNITFAWEHAVAITNEADRGKLVSHRFPQFKFNDNMLPRFFKYAILDDRFRHHLWLASPGGAGRNRVLKIEEMLKYKFWVPETLEEQGKIANYFDRLTEMTELLQQELIKLQHLKKALFEKMFI